MTWRDYAENVLWNLSRLLNSLLFGDPNDSLSARIGWSRFKGGFWSRVPMPAIFARHFEKAARWTL